MKTWKPMSPKQSRKEFRRKGAKVHPYNTNPKPFRGGIRL